MLATSAIVVTAVIAVSTVETMTAGVVLFTKTVGRGNCITGMSGIVRPNAAE
jgi:hypothetical protein